MTHCECARAQRTGARNAAVHARQGGLTVRQTACSYMSARHDPVLVSDAPISGPARRIRRVFREVVEHVSEHDVTRHAAASQICADTRRRSVYTLSPAEAFRARHQLVLRWLRRPLPVVGRAQRLQREQSAPHRVSAPGRRSRFAGGFPRRQAQRRLDRADDDVHQVVRAFHATIRPPEVDFGGPTPHGPRHSSGGSTSGSTW